jgi:nucleoside-diphosphate-sugar epimerase
VISTSEDSTFGRGKNTDAGTWPTTRAVAWNATFTLSAPYALLEGEAALRDLAGDRASVLRLGGIYGPGRLRLISEVRAGVGCPREPVRFTNRIHRDDAAAILQFLLEKRAAGQALAPCYLGVDCARSSQPRCVPPGISD